MADIMSLLGLGTSLLGGAGGGMAGGVGTTGGYSMTMTQAQYIQNDLLQAQTIQYQMMANTTKQAMERWKLMQETQIKTFEIAQDVTVNQAKAEKKCFDKWTQYIQS